MWASALFRVGRVGPKFVYSFKNIETPEAEVTALRQRIFAYTHNSQRTIEHAKAILRNHGIHNIG